MLGKWCGLRLSSAAAGGMREVALKCSCRSALTFSASWLPALQEVVFEEVAPLIRSCADGYNVCIFVSASLHV